MIFAFHLVFTRFSCGFPAKQAPRKRLSVIRVENTMGAAKKIFPTERRYGQRANRQRPRDSGNRSQDLSSHAAELPCRTCQEQKKNPDKKPETNIEVTRGPVESLRIEMNRAHRGHHRINAPLWRRLSKAERVARGEKHKQNGSDSVGKLNVHCCPPIRNPLVRGIIRYGQDSFAGRISWHPKAKAIFLTCRRRTSNILLRGLGL
jgi:hypothetical protein